MSRSWTIGSLPDCDLVVSLQFVSGRHCCLTLDERGYSLEDLQSANGTFVNGIRISEKVRVSKNDAITLGRTTPIPWPVSAEAEILKSTVLRIGREPDNDFVIPLPIVSGHHAQVIWEGKPGEATIEDLGSANGTAIGSPDLKMPRSLFRAGDTIYFGTHAVSASELLSRFESPVIPPVTESSDNLLESLSISESAVTTPDSLVTTNRAGLAGPLIHDLALLLQAPILGFAIGMIFWSSLPSTRGEASVLFWLGLAALWFGLSNAVFGDVRRANPPVEGSLDAASSLRRLAKASLFGVLQCLVAWIIVSRLSGQGGGWLGLLAFLLLASTVGLALGCVIVSLDLKPGTRGAALLLVMVLLWLFGAGPQSLPRMAPWAKVVSNVIPSRWTFEGLLLQSNPPGNREVDKSLDQGPEAEQAEIYFPSDSERMGTRADVMALISMLLGFSAASAFVIWTSQGDRAATSSP
jgi:pSer/pThr/pTyr-binding forkhead associated (FHA) protein